MDSRNSNTLLPAKHIGEAEKISNYWEPIRLKIMLICSRLELENKKAASDKIVSLLPFESPFSIRRELCVPNFILTDEGWRVPVVRRVLVWLKSSTGFICVIKDLLHVACPNYSRKGDYLVSEYNTKTKECINEQFYIWHKEIKDQINV